MSNKHLVVEIATWGSVSYVQSLALRFEVLRKPLGLVFDPSIFLQENLDVHLIAKHGDWVVGCMILTPKEQLFKMRQVAVDPRFQRQGVGSKWLNMRSNTPQCNRVVPSYCMPVIQQFRFIMPWVTALWVRDLKRLGFPTTPCKSHW